jgi:hypothetical protein
MMYELVFCGTQNRMSGLRPKAGFVDSGLGVFYSIANGEGLGLYVDPMIEQHLKAISGTVAYGENNMAAV